MEKNFNSCLVMKLELEKLIKGLNTAQPYNIFCHHINESKTENMDETINGIFANGLACNYSTVSRTLTFLGTNENVNINSIFKYIYISQNWHVRNTFILAIPKYIKLPTGFVDYSTPENYKHGSVFRAHTLLDFTKQNHLRPSFNLACIKINEPAKQFTLVTNDNHMCSKESLKNKELSAIKSEIIAYNNAKNTTA